MKFNDLSRYRLSDLNLFAPPDRRYRLAKLYLRRGIPPSFNDDKITRELYRFLQKRESARESRQRGQLLSDHQGLAVAFDLHHGKAQRLRPALEAFLLTELDDKSIAKKFGLPVEALYGFRKAFYDIQHLIAFPVRVLHQLIRVAAENGEADLDVHKVWKLVGYVLKSKALDQLLDINAESSLPSEREASAWLALKTQAIVTLKQLIGVGSLNPADPKQLASLLKLSRQVRQGSDDASHTVYEEHIKAMLDNIPWTIGDDGETQYRGTKIGKFDESAVELRDDELQLLATGHDVPGLDELADLTIPPPKKLNPTLGRADFPLK